MIGEGWGKNCILHGHNKVRYCTLGMHDGDDSLVVISINEIDESNCSILPLGKNQPSFCEYGHEYAQGLHG